MRQVGKGAIVAAGAVLRPGTVVPCGEIWAGNPAAKHRAMKDTEHSYLPKLAAAYVELGAQHSRAVPKTLQASHLFSCCAHMAYKPRFL